jgi:hypothetical protein
MKPVTEHIQRRADDASKPLKSDSKQSLYDRSYESNQQLGNHDKRPTHPADNMDTKALAKERGASGESHTCASEWKSHRTHRPATTRRGAL